MPSISKKSTLRIIASAAGGNSICLVLNDYVDDAYSIVLIFDDTKDDPWRRIDLDYDVADVCCSSPGETGLADYVAVASSGEALFLSSPPTIERINQEGIWRRIDSGAGMLSGIRNIGDKLYAMGRGGQAYTRAGDANWAALSSTYPLEEIRDDHVNLDCGEKGPDATGMIFGGSSVPKIVDNRERAKLLAAGDMDAYKRALRQIRRSYGTLWILRQNEWIKVPLPTTATVTDLLNVPKHGVFASTSYGSVSRISSEDEIEIIYSTPTRKDIPDLSIWNGRLIIVHSGELMAHDFGAGGATSIVSPDEFSMMTDFHSNQGATWLVDGRGFAKWTGDGWSEITIPPALLR